MRWLFAPLLAMSLLIGTPAVARVPEPEIWFNPHGPAVDLMAMWTQDAPWQQAARKVNVLSLVHWWVVQQSDATLTQVFDFAKQHHMQIELSTEPIAKLPTDTCGNEEGYMSIGQMTAAVATLVRLGVKLDWIDLDGPVASGSYDPGPNACHYSIPDLVTRVAMTVSYVVAAFPAVKIMEIEPVPGLMQTPTWRQDETAFHVGLQQQLGKTVQAMMTDVTWQNPAWRQGMLDEHAYLREQNMGLAVIYDANALTTNDTDWINSAVANWEAVESQLHIIPDQAVFTSWDANPTYNMPDTSPTAQTWLINRYVRPQSILQAQFVGQGVHGKLITPDGKPIVNVTINGFKPGVDVSKPLPVQVVQGVVPSTAVQALIGVRVNTECGCNGMNDLLFGPISYQESQGGSSRYSIAFPTTSGTQNGAILGGELVGGTMVTRVIAFPGQSVTLNSSAFPVTANARYQFSIPAGTIGGVGWLGNVILIFIDANGNGTRVTAVPDAGKALISSAVTAADGTFALPKLPRSVDGPNPVTVEFDGAGGTYRSNMWTPLQ